MRDSGRAGFGTEGTEFTRRLHGRRQLLYTSVPDECSVQDRTVCVASLSRPISS